MPDISDPDGPRRAASLAPGLAALAQNGAGICVASCEDDGTPIVGLGIGCRIGPDGTIRILLSRSANLRLVQAIEAGAAVAVTFTATCDHSSFQVKSSHAQFKGPCPDDSPEAERQITLFREGLVEIGFLPDQAVGYSTYEARDLVSIEFLPERIYSQTPGPGAGTEMAG